MTEELNKRLESIENTSKRGYKARGLSKLLKNLDLWKVAYSNLYPNQGAMTKGVDNTTMDSFSEDRAINLIELIERDLYRSKPSRRVYISKRNGGKRPLGIPTGDSKLVQEVVRLLLERVYEPIFSEKSHGFRPRRSCHTALKGISETWTGVVWIVDYDIKGFYDNMDHEILIKLLEKKIDDRKFINLIRNMLRAGYLEDWKFHKTYSGVPQGGVVSPVLSNIYLHELDQYMEERIKAFNKGKERARSTEYESLSKEISRLRKEIDGLKEGGQSEAILKLKEQIRVLDKERKGMASKDRYDPTYRRLYYCRYADDLLNGVIGSREEAEQIMKETIQYLDDELHLGVNPNKTGIKHAKEGTLFLGYTVKEYTSDKVVKLKIGKRYTTQRFIRNRIQLEVPEEKPYQFCKKNRYGSWEPPKSLHKPELTSLSDTEIILTYNAELRGLANYYSLGRNVKSKLNKLQYIWRGSLLKTLANKHKTKVSKIVKTLKSGKDLILRYKKEGKDKSIKVYKLADLQRRPKNWDNLDEIPNPFKYSARTEIIERINANKCEYCGKEKGYFEVHHARKLADIKDGKELWQKLMMARSRKTLILCIECHGQLHAGKLPSWKRSVYDKMESGVR